MKKRRSKSTRRNEFIKAALIIVLIGLVLRMFVFLPYRLKGPEMEDTLYEGDFFLVNRLAYRFGEPKIGDVIVFEHPLKVDETAIGRIIATEGMSVEIVGKKVYVDGELLEETGHVKHGDYRIIPQEFSNRDYLSKIQVPGGAFFVLSDNRDIISDSRDFGAVPGDEIIGKGMFVYWSWRPDPNSPRWESPYITPAVKILLYNLFHFPSRVRWSRLGASPD